MYVILSYRQVTVVASLVTLADKPRCITIKDGVTISEKVYFDRKRHIRIGYIYIVVYRLS